MGTVLGRVLASQNATILDASIVTSHRDHAVDGDDEFIIGNLASCCKGVIRFATSPVPTMAISRLPTRYSATISVGAKSLVGNP